MQDNGTLFYLYQILSASEKREVTYQLAHREKLSGKPSQVKELHLALGKSKAKHEEGLFKALPAARKWKDLAQTKRKLLRAILDTLVGQADHPAAVVRRMMTELELLAHHRQQLTLLHLAEATILLAREHELFQDAVDSYYLWDAARVVCQAQDPNFPVSDQMGMLQEMMLDAEKLHELHQAERFFQRCLWAASSGGSYLLDDANNDDPFDGSLPQSSLKAKVFYLRARYIIEIHQRKHKEAIGLLDQLLAICDSTAATRLPELKLLRPTFLFNLGLSHIECNDELQFRAVAAKLKAGIEQKSDTDAHYFGNYYALLLNYHLVAKSDKNATLHASKLLAEMKASKPDAALSTDMMAALVHYSYRGRDWSNAIKHSSMLLVTKNTRYIFVFTIWMVKLVAMIEMQNSAGLKAHLDSRSVVIKSGRAGDFETELVSCLQSLGKSNSPKEVRKALKDRSARLSSLLDAHPYQEMEDWLQLKGWLAKLA
jgi:hypothetical protein